MAFKINCKRCGSTTIVADYMGGPGKKVKCKKCRRPLNVPASDGAPSASQGATTKTNDLFQPSATNFAFHKNIAPPLAVRSTSAGIIPPPSQRQRQRQRQRQEDSASIDDVFGQDANADDGDIEEIGAATEVAEEQDEVDNISNRLPGKNRGATPMSKQKYLNKIRSTSAYPTYRAVIGFAVALGHGLAGLITLVALIGGALLALSVNVFVSIAVIGGGLIIATLIFIITRFVKEAALILADVSDSIIDDNSRG